MEERTAQVDHAAFVTPDSDIERPRGARRISRHQLDGVATTSETYVDVLVQLTLRAESAVRAREVNPPDLDGQAVRSLVFGQRPRRIGSAGSLGRSVSQR